MSSLALGFLAGFGLGMLTWQVIARRKKESRFLPDDPRALHEFIGARAKLQTLRFYASGAEGSPSVVRTGTSPGSDTINHEFGGYDSGEHYEILLDTSGRFVDIQEDFCRFVGYKRGELLGKPIEMVTASNLLDVSKNLGMFFFFGRARGLWMFIGREGARLLVHYEWELLPDFSIRMRFERTG
jgi:PAS domain-containing protein